MPLAAQAWDTSDLGETGDGIHLVQENLIGYRDRAGNRPGAMLAVDGFEGSDGQFAGYCSWWVVIRAGMINSELSWMYLAS
jgi:hypothetical protein